MKNKITISGYSTALFSTWFFIEELGILFDAGDGIVSGLLQKSRKIKNVFISHADRDHLMGLFQFNQLNARDGFPKIHYPSDCGSFPAIKNFVNNFDPQSRGTIWIPIENGDKINITKNIYVQAMKNNHVQTVNGAHKSFSFKVFQTKRKLKPEFQELDENSLKILVQDKGQEFITKEISNCILAYSGDTPVDHMNNWDGTKILIHEATFLNHKDGKEANKNKHSNLEEVFDMISGINVENLILSHFSTRYNKDQIDSKIKELCKKHQIDFPVFRILPGVLHRDILNSQALSIH